MAISILKLTQKSLVLFIVMTFGTTCSAQLQLELVSTECIWDHAPHNAFTDLIRWRGKFYCAFREGKGHADDIGSLRIIVSEDGSQWSSAGLLSMDDHDLRDASLSITPDDRLMVLGGAQQSKGGKRRTGSFVSFSTDGQDFSEPQLVMPLGRWLWRVTWIGDTAYGVSYGTPDNQATSALHKTKDGIHFETVTNNLLDQGGWPTEARLRFDDNGVCYCLHRRDGANGNSAMLGTAKPPYESWEWTDLERRIGGPDLIQLPTREWIAAGRLYDAKVRTAVMQIWPEEGRVKPLLTLPSGGDTSYPGMVVHQDILWVSYYSSHEGKSKIYLAKIQVPSSD